MGELTGQKQQLQRKKTDMLQKHKEALSHAENKAYLAWEKASLARGEETGRLYAAQDEKIKGAYIFHMAVLHSPPGQAFLDVIVNEFPEAFIYSPQFLLLMLQPLSFWVTATARETCKQLKEPT